MDKANQILREILGLGPDDELPFEFVPLIDREQDQVTTRLRVSAAITLKLDDITEPVIRHKLRGALVEMARFAVDMRAKIHE